MTDSTGSGANIDILDELAGDTIDRTFTITNAAGTARDITTDTVRMDVPFPTALNLATGTGITITSATTGVGTLQITDTLTEAAGVGTFAYGLKVEDSSGKEKTVAWGQIKLLAKRVT